MGGTYLKKEFEAEVEDNSYMGTYGWIEEVYINRIGGSEDFEDLMRKFVGKKVKVTIEEIK